MTANHMCPLFLCLVFLTGSCDGGAETPVPRREASTPPVARPYRVVHIFVALCDNTHQGIVPVPAKLGNGQDPKNNLYWGAMYGADAFFARSPHWKRVAVEGAPRRGEILARTAFVATVGKKKVTVVMDAYDGRHMKATLTDFLDACAGGLSATFTLKTDNGKQHPDAGGRADLVCFVGHNGLMDLTLETTPTRRGKTGPEAAVVLACRSRAYFAGPLRKAGCRGLLLTTGLMAPEAYTLDAAIRSWASDEAPEKVLAASASAYATYQKCSGRAARRLFFSEAKR